MFTAHPNKLNPDALKRYYEQIKFLYFFPEEGELLILLFFSCCLITCNLTCWGE